MPARRPTRISRRSFLKGSIASAVAISAGAVADAWLVEPYWIRLTRPEVWIRDLPPAWEGVRMALWADTHSGYLLDEQYLQKAIELTQAARPDMLLLAGDIVSQSDEASLEKMIRVLRALPCEEMKFASLGNHDNIPSMHRACLAAGVELLVNESRLLDRQGQKLCMAGVADEWNGRPSIQQALAHVPPQVPRIVIGHNPDYAEMLARPPISASVWHAPRVDLLLCGHTHGGQICLPWIGPLVTATRNRNHVQGLTRGPTCQVYTTAGLGMGIIGMRFRCRPELPILTLRRA